MMTLSSLPSTIARDEQGFTLIEMLVAVVSGVVVMMALFALLDFSVNQSGRIADKVDADQQGRIALEKISLEMHSSCIAAAVTPVQSGSEDNSVEFISVPGSQAYQASAELHHLYLQGNELIDDDFKSTGGEPPVWTFPPLASIPASHQTLLSNVAQSETGEPRAQVPLFRYYRYYTAADKSAVLGEINPTPMETPLSEKDAQSTAEVTVSFTAYPTSNAHPTPEETGNDRSANLSDSVLLRFSPTSATSNNAACS